MFCTRCGLRVEEGNRFCQNCGQEVGASAPAVPIAGSALPPPAATTAPVSAPLPYAGFWLRLVAFFIDGLILGIPFLLVVIVAIFFLGGFGLMMRRNPVDPHVAAALIGPLILGYLLVMLLFVLLEWLYFAGMQSSERQATFGKAVMSLKVTDAEGRRLSFGHATGRFFAKIVSGLIPFGIGYIMAGFTAKKQALHDMIAGTLVLRKM
jgi:uncharacterized RDD family membrane protein YckC